MSSWNLLQQFSMFPSACLSSHPSICLTALHCVPHLCWELIWRNSLVALCDHPVNTPIIFSTSAPYPAMEMIPSSWQFNLSITDEGYHACTHALSPFPVDFYSLPTKRKRDAAGARPTIPRSTRLQWRLLSSSSLLVLWGEMLPLVYVTLSVPP